MEYHGPAGEGVINLKGRYDPVTRIGRVFNHSRLSFDLSPKWPSQGHASGQGIGGAMMAFDRQDEEVLGQRVR